MPHTYLSDLSAAFCGLGASVVLSRLVGSGGWPLM